MSVHSLDKLAPKVIKTIFTGYPPNQKGYKFFDHVIKITHGSRHVVFHEHIFPFKDTNNFVLYPPSTSFFNTPYSSFDSLGTPLAFPSLEDFIHPSSVNIDSD